MAFIKKGTVSSVVVMSSSVYTCPKCGYMEIVKDTDETKICVECDEQMVIASSSIEELSDNQSSSSSSD